MNLDNLRDGSIRTGLRACRRSAAGPSLRRLAPLAEPSAGLCRAPASRFGPAVVRTATTTPKRQGARRVRGVLLPRSLPRRKSRP